MSEEAREIAISGLMQSAPKLDRAAARSVVLRRILGDALYEAAYGGAPPPTQPPRVSRRASARPIRLRGALAPGGLVKLLGIGVIVQLVACVVVGARLLALWRRTRLIPELAFGLSFVLLGAVGYPLSIVARSAGSDELLSAALLAQNVAALSLFLGVWRTFRPFERWVGGVAIALGIAFLASLAAPFIDSIGPEARDGGAWYYLGFAARFGSFAWAAFESTRYFFLLKRRLPLGLTDETVVDRFRLWSISNIGISLSFAVFLAGRLFTENVGQAPWVLICTSVVGLVSGTAMWLAFFPPQRYLRRFAA